MKIIVDKNGIAKYNLLESTVIISYATYIEVRGDKDFNIHDLNSENSTVYGDVTDTPEDFIGDKYEYNGTDWIVNPDYIEPTEPDPNSLV